MSWKTIALGAAIVLALAGLAVAGENGETVPASGCAQAGRVSWISGPVFAGRPAQQAVEPAEASTCAEVLDCGPCSEVFCAVATLRAASCCPPNGDCISCPEGQRIQMQECLCTSLLEGGGSCPAQSRSYFCA
jgi:hypothetical protein